jgi:hypothetical protein
MRRNEISRISADFTHALRLKRREPGPEGLTIISDASDEKLIRQVYRIRQLAERTEARLTADLTGNGIPVARLRTCGG